MCWGTLSFNLIIYLCKNKNEGSSLYYKGSEMKDKSQQLVSVGERAHTMPDNLSLIQVTRRVK